MTKNKNELEICKRKVLKLQNRLEEVINDDKKKRRAKDMELAGINEMIKQLQDEIRIYQLTEIQQSIHTLKNDLQEADSANLPKVLQETLDLIEEMANVLQPASNLQT